VIYTNTQKIWLLADAYVEPEENLPSWQRPARRTWLQERLRKVREDEHGKDTGSN